MAVAADRAGFHGDSPRVARGGGRIARGRRRGYEAGHVGVPVRRRLVRQQRLEGPPGGEPTEHPLGGWAETFDAASGVQRHDGFARRLQYAACPCTLRLEVEAEAGLAQAAGEAGTEGIQPDVQVVGGSVRARLDRQQPARAERIPHDDLPAMARRRRRNRWDLRPVCTACETREFRMLEPQRIAESRGDGLRLGPGRRHVHIGVDAYERLFDGNVPAFQQPAACEPRERHGDSADAAGPGPGLDPIQCHPGPARRGLGSGKRAAVEAAGDVGHGRSRCGRPAEQGGDPAGIGTEPQIIIEKAQERLPVDGIARTRSVCHAPLGKRRIRCHGGPIAPPVGTAGAPGPAASSDPCAFGPAPGT